MVFNRTVENCHGAFIFLSRRAELLAGKLLSRVSFFARVLSFTSA